MYIQKKNHTKADIRADRILGGSIWWEKWPVAPVGRGNMAEHLCTYGTTLPIPPSLVSLSYKNLRFQNHLIETAHQQHPTAASTPSSHMKNKTLNFSREVGLFSPQQIRSLKDSHSARKARPLWAPSLQHGEDKGKNVMLWHNIFVLTYSRMEHAFCIVKSRAITSSYLAVGWMITRQGPSVWNIRIC